MSVALRDVQVGEWVIRQKPGAEPGGPTLVIHMPTWQEREFSSRAEALKWAREQSAGGGE